MKRTWLIIEREYVTRVKKKSFLLATLITPILFPLLIGGMIYLAREDTESIEQKTIQVYDPGNEMNIPESGRFSFVAVSGDSLQRITAFQESDDYALLVKKPGSQYELYTKSAIPISEQSALQNLLRQGELQTNMDKLQLSEEDRMMLSPRIALSTFNVVSEGESSSAASMGLGYLGGFLIYMFIFLYGAQVMQGVIAEKSNKIVEVIIATVRPFQLMMGKVIGVASVGLTQFALWVAILWVAFTVIFSNESMSETMSQFAILNSLRSISFGPLVLTFVFYFIGGYFLYGALFAAIGSAVDTPSEAQQFMFPITLPLIASIIGLGAVLNNPEGDLAFWLSIIPLTSPVTMMGRMGFGTPPLWELALSMVLLVLFIFFSIWLASRIYRIGILIHGSKINYKVLVRWLMQRN